MRRYHGTAVAGSITMSRTGSSHFHAGSTARRLQAPHDHAARRRLAALARWSGGHVDHLLQIARRAVESTEPERVTVAAIERAGRALGIKLLARLRPEDLPRAVEVHQTHRIRPTAQDLRMLGAACVLTYGGEPVWWDVHPALQAEALLLRARQGWVG